MIDKFSKDEQTKLEDLIDNLEKLAKRHHRETWGAVEGLTHEDRTEWKAAAVIRELLEEKRLPLNAKSLKALNEKYLKFSTPKELMDDLDDD